jgi:hypothetical protein
MAESPKGTAMAAGPAGACLAIIQICERQECGDRSMRKTSRLSRERRTRRARPGKPGTAPTPIASALPTYLVSSLAAGAGFQCERCFFPDTGRAPVAAGVVSAETTRWWADLAEEPSGKEILSEESQEG